MHPNHIIINFQWQSILKLCAHLDQEEKHKCSTAFVKTSKSLDAMAPHFVYRNESSVISVLVLLSFIAMIATSELFSYIVFMIKIPN
jgi:hypothetical protein